jgi:mTERF domain-containing protein
MQLRTTTEPQARAALLQQLDRSMSHWAELYQPSAVEEFLATELHVWSYNVMLFAVQTPPLQGYDLEGQVRPAVHSLKAAGLDNNDVWFLVTKRLELLAQPISLQRWLDFLGAQVCVHVGRGKAARTHVCVCVCLCVVAAAGCVACSP